MESALMSESSGMQTYTSFPSVSELSVNLLGAWSVKRLQQANWYVYALPPC